MSIRLSDHEKAALDAARGGMKAPDYLRSLIPGGQRATVYPGEPSMVDQVPLPQQVAPKVPPVESPLTEQMPDPQEQVTALVTNARHLHKYVKGDQVGWDRGNKVYLHTCACGLTKEDY